MPPPNNPLDPKNAEALSRHLSDIAVKMEKLKPFADFQLFEVSLPQVNDLNEELNKLAKTGEQIGRVWQRAGKNFENVVKAGAKYAEQVRKIKSDMINLVKKRDEALVLGDKKEAAKRTKEIHERAQALIKLAKAEKDLPGKAEILVKSGVQSGLSGFDWLTKTLGGFTLTTFGKFYEKLSDALKLSERFRGIFGNMARTLGAGTPQIETLHEAITSLYFDKGGLGELGFSAEEVGQKVTGLASSFGYAGEMAAKDIADLSKLGLQLNVDDASMGEFNRTMRFMNTGLEDQKDLLVSVKEDAKLLGVNTALLSKNVVSAGRNLFAWFGPAASRQLRATIEALTKIGISTQSIESFTKMTDIFDNTAGSIAKLNSVFGTHMNAMQIFLEDDPGKRLDMIGQSLIGVGKDMEHIGRRERTLIADTLGLTMDEVNALTRIRKEEESYEDTLRKLMTRKKNIAELDDRIADGQAELAVTLLNWGRVWDKISMKVLQVAGPFLKVFGVKGEVGEGFESWNKLAQKFIEKISGAFDALSGTTKFNDALTRMGETLNGLLDRFLTWIGSGEFIDFITATATNLSTWVTAAGRFVGFLMSPAFLNTVTFLMENFRKIAIAWAVIRGASAGAAVGGLLGPIGAAVGLLGGGIGAGIGMAQLTKQSEPIPVTIDQNRPMVTPNPPSGMGKALGGPVSTDMSYLVGERGPERFVPDSPGRIVPEANGGDNAPITVNVILDGEIIQQKTLKRNLRSYQ